MNFTKKLQLASNKNSSLVCVGLDTDITKIPAILQKSSDPIFEFNKAIIDATKDLVLAYKPNCAFYEAQGVKGLEALEKTIDYIPDDIPVILDAKRGDIGNTSRQYAIACFEHLKADAVTLSPYMGFDTIAPFTEYEEKALFILVKTSNASAGEIQDLETNNNQKIFLETARLISKWQKTSAAIIGAVTGATYPEDLKAIREILPGAPLLIPGLGSQGGDAKKTISYGLGTNNSPIVVNSSRGIIYASGESNFAEAAREKAKEFKEQLNEYKLSI